MTCVTPETSSEKLLRSARNRFVLASRHRPLNSAGLPPVKPLTQERGRFFSRKGGAPRELRKVRSLRSADGP